MNLTLEEAYNQAIASVQHGRHKNYDRTVDLAEKYAALITGDNMEKILQRFVKREEVEEFKQRLELTQAICVPVCEKIQKPFNKLLRTQGLTRIVESESDINEQIENFWGEQSLDEYIEEVFVDLSFTDPNAFIVIEFKNIDGEIEVYPVAYPSHMIFNYLEVNNSVKWLQVQGKCTYMESDKAREGDKYIFYSNKYQVILSQISKNEYLSLSKEMETGAGVEIDKKYYKVEIVEPNLNQTQFIRVGYQRDRSTGLKTFINPFHSAIPRLDKLMKNVSELDLTTSLHAFPQKYQYVETCTYRHEEHGVCRDGKYSNGATCSNCKGTGQVIHTSASDVITMKLPDLDNTEAKDVFPLDKLVHYSSPDVNVVKFQDEYVDKLERQCLDDIFLSNALERTTTTKTATEINTDMESVYDVLYKFGKKISRVWMKSVRLIAEINNFKLDQLAYAFPKDLKMKTKSMLLDDLKRAKDADISEHLKIQIQTDIAEKMYQDNPLELDIYKKKLEHIPFAGKTESQIQLFIAGGLANEFDTTLWVEFESIVTTVDNEQMKKNQTSLWKMTFDKRSELIKEEVEKRLQQKTATIDLSEIDE